MYLSLKNIGKKWTMPIHNWSEPMSLFAILFENWLPTKSLSNRSLHKISPPLQDISVRYN
jgi:hypothetical protein